MIQVPMLLRRPDACAASRVLNTAVRLDEVRP